MRFLSAISLAALAGACASGVTEQPTSTSAFNPSEEVYVERHVQAPMRDGTRLDTHIFVPNGASEPVPSILIRTPYDSELNGRSGVLYQRLLDMGYAIIEQHERGRYLSEGEFYMIPRPEEDGWDTLDWISNQSWSDGRVATIGCSSSAENQPKLAAAGHPAHVAFVAMSAGVGVAEAGPFKEQGNFWRGGAWQQGWFDYFYEAMHQDWPQLPAGVSDEERQRLSARFTLENSGWGVDPKRYDETRMHLPMIDIMEELDAPRNEVAEYLTRGPSHPDWSENRISEGEAIEIPGFWAEALYDISTRSTVAYFNWNHGEGLKIGRDNQTLRITQGGHCSFGRETEDWSIGDLALGDARFPLHDEIVAWFSHWMPVDRDVARQDAVDTGVKAYVADGTWIEGDTLSYGGGDVWSLAANGAFGAAADLAADLTYTYNPADPVPSMGGEIGGTGTDHDDGAFDQTPLEARQDVLVFTSDPLEASIDFVGYANVSLSVSSDRPDTDFTVKLMDVYPDGRAYNIGDTILRMRHRDGVDKSVFMEAGQRYDVELPPILLTRRIEAGHSLRVHVSSSNFPNYARNLNTAQDPYTSTDQEIATNTIYVGGDAVSRIEWPAPLR